ncbi:MAG TPA: SRPBCC domain-containing protein [Rhizomicrobium sp.]|jgi:uncharacterized protein YndB with AHSA1/START domain
MKSEMETGRDWLRLTRIFDAPRAVLFKWWASGERLQQWFGVAGMARCEIETDFQVGGAFKQTMQMADGREFSSSGVYEEIIVPERIVYRTNFGAASMRVTVEFIDLGKQTKLVLSHEGPVDESFIDKMTKGTSSALDLLDELVRSELMQHGEDHT